MAAAFASSWGTPRRSDAESSARRDSSGSSFPSATPTPPAHNRVGRVQFFGGPQHGYEAIVGIAGGSGYSHGYFVANTEAAHVPGAYHVQGLLARFSIRHEVEWRVVIRAQGLIKLAGVALAPDGGAYVVGHTRDQEFHGQASHGELDIFLSRFGPDGDELWTRLLGGDGREWAHAVAVAPDGDVLVVATTRSSAVGAATGTGTRDALLLRVSPAGALESAHIAGGDGIDEGQAVATMQDGTVLLVGSTGSSTFEGSPTKGGRDLFALSISEAGDRQAVRILGGQGHDFGYGVAVDWEDRIFVVGASTAPRLLGEGNAGRLDALVARLNPDLTVNWLRLTGGDDLDTALGVAAGADIQVVGRTDGASIDGVPDAGDGPDAFLASFSMQGERRGLRVIGGDGTDWLAAVASGSGETRAVGATSSAAIGRFDNPARRGMLLVRFR